MSSRRPFARSMRSRTFTRRSHGNRPLALHNRRVYRRAPVSVGYTDNLLKGIDLQYARGEGPFSGNNPIVTSNVSSNSGILCVNAIRQGTSFYERIGRKVNLKSLQIRGQLSARAPSGLTPEALIVRMMVVYDRQPNGAIPTFDQMFSAASPAGDIASNTVMAPVNLTQTSRFRVLRDKMFTLQPMRGMNVLPDGEGIAPVSDVGGYYSKSIRDFIRLPSLETVYNATNEAPSIAQIASGALYVIFRATVPSRANGDDDVIVAEFDDSNFRLRYVDC